MKTNELLLDSFGRIREIVAATLDDADSGGADSGGNDGSAIINDGGADDGGDVLLRRPGGTGNSIAWLIWHLGRVEDAQVASAAGLEQVWTAEGFVRRFGLPLPEGDTGYGHSSSQVDAVKASPGLLLEYYDAVHRQTEEFLAGLGDEDLDRVVDKRWDPPVTLGVRLVSTIADCLQHAGQAAYAKGLGPRTA